ncbi:MAG: type I-E CRISPR-associated protein Cas6/Cse3/CasE [Planctomycetes bacterium]|nr:type I-E CRISPR-associated protein Cas6/Cse3/CasE [Planctomycetota bacterium]
MKISRLCLDPADHVVRAALADPQRMHSLVMAAFPRTEGPARAAMGVLHRVELDDHGNCTLLVQSNSIPQWQHLPNSALVARDRTSIEIRDLDADLATVQPDSILLFRVLANPTRRIDTKTREDGRRRHGKRVPLRDHAARVNWLLRKAAAAGFELVAGWSGEPNLRILDHAAVRGRRGTGDEARTVTIEGVTFEGVLRVTDVSAFRKAVTGGIGPARAYGFGMLSFRPMR